MNLSLIIKIIVSITWYADLNKPFFNPPNWIFAPAWTILYVLMGIAFAYVWDDKTDDGLKAKALKLFIYQFLLNLIWTPVFFYFKQPMAALVIIIVLVGMLLLTMNAFRNVDSKPFLLLIPYFLWVCFATCLNASIVYLN